jgi:hypothetical protein
MLAFAVTGWSQPRRSEEQMEQRIKAQVEQLTAELNLSDEQASKIQELLMEESRQMRELWSGGSRNREEMRERMMNIRSDTDKKVKDILSGEQYTGWEKWRQQQRERMRERMSRPGRRP